MPHGPAFIEGKSLVYGENRRERAAATPNSFPEHLRCADGSSQWIADCGYLAWCHRSSPLHIGQQMTSQRRLAKSLVETQPAKRNSASTGRIPRAKTATPKP